MMRFWRFLPMLAVLLATVGLAMPPPAQGAFQVDIYVDSVLTTSLNNGTNTIFSASLTVGPFSISNLSASANSPGSSLNFAQTGTTIITNTSGVSHTLGIFTSATGFAVPPTSALTNTASGSLLVGSMSGNFTSYAGAGASLFNTAFSTPTVSFSVSGVSQSFGGSSSASGFSPSVQYSLSHLGNYTMGAGSVLTLTGGNTTIEGSGGPLPVPGPGGLALVLAGLPFLGVSWLRRRVQAA